MPKHTPGPWRFVENEGVVVGPNGEEVISDEFHGSMVAFAVDCKETNRANATLIAAAPDLLKACRGVVENSRFDHTDMMRIRAAIAKATGGE